MAKIVRLLMTQACALLNYRLHVTITHTHRNCVRPRNIKRTNQCSDLSFQKGQAYKMIDRLLHSRHLSQTSKFHLSQKSMLHPYSVVSRHPLELADSHSIRCTHSLLGRSQRMFSTSARGLFSNEGDKTSVRSQISMDLDLETRLSAENLDDLRKNLELRGSDFDLDGLLADYRRWKGLDDKKTSLERERNDIAKTMASLVKGKMVTEKTDEKEQLMQSGKAVRDQLKTVMPSWNEAEPALMEQAVKLPTDLHPLTPVKEDLPVETWQGSVTDAGCTSHVQFGEQLGLLKFSSAGPRAVYLRGPAAELEQALLHSAATCLADGGYSPLAGPEMFRSVVVDGCGLRQEKVFSLESKEEERETNLSFLTGTSLLSYAAFLAKVQVRKDCLPLKLFSVGRHYKPQSGGDDLPGLYGTVQSNRVTMFGATFGEEKTTELHDEMVETAWGMVRQLGLPVRKMLVSSSRLAPSESLRTDLQIWAPATQQYVPMGSVSVHSDFASRRLMCRTSDGRLLHMVSGVAVDTSVLVASMMEHSFKQGSFELLPAPLLKNFINVGG